MDSVPLLHVLCRGSMALLKDLIPCNNSTQIKKRKIPVVMGTLSVLVTLPPVVPGASLTTTGEMKNSQFSFSASQPLHMNPAALLYLPFISHLMQADLHVCLLFSLPNSNANSEKLFIVCRQLPPGVLVSQKALQMQWEIKFHRFFSPNTMRHMQMWWVLLIICYEVMYLPHT